MYICITDHAAYYSPSRDDLSLPLPQRRCIQTSTTAAGGGGHYSELSDYTLYLWDRPDGEEVCVSVFWFICYVLDLVERIVLRSTYGSHDFKLEIDNTLIGRGKATDKDHVLNTIVIKYQIRRFVI